MEELWDAYDKDGNRLKGITLIRENAVFDNGVFHVISGVIVRHVDGSYLLMQRDFNKSCGGKWDFTAIGSVKQVETALDGAIRELKEETGIECRKLELVSQVAKEDFHGIFIHYVCTVNCEKDAVILQDGETIAYKWVDKKTLLSMKDEDFASPNERRILLSWENSGN